MVSFSIAARRINAIRYSGLPLKRLKLDHNNILDLIDVLIPEPYINNSLDAPLWRGSANQPLVPLSQLGEEIFCTVSEYSQQKRFQLNVTNGKVWFIGVPGRGDLQRMETLAARCGLRLRGVSWREEEKHSSQAN